MHNYVFSCCYKEAIQNKHSTNEGRDRIGLSKMNNTPLIARWLLYMLRWSPGGCSISLVARWLLCTVSFAKWS